MNKLSLVAAAMLIVALPNCGRKKADTNTCTTECCPQEVRESGPMQDLHEDDMK